MQFRLLLRLLIWRWPPLRLSSRVTLSFPPSPLFSSQMASREQMAVLEFSESLLIIPKVLSVNAAKDATELVANLRANHYIAQHSPDQEHVKFCGLELVEGGVRNNFEAGVLEPAMSKVKIIQFATEAAITILRIDDMIKLEKMEEEQ